VAKKTLGYEELQWACPNCEGINPGSEKTCGNCGAPQPDDVKFEQKARGELLQDGEAITKAKAGPDIHCPYCRTRNHGDAETCVQCGGDLVGGEVRKSGEVLGAFQTRAEQIVTCPRCGTENPDSAMTCSQCGGGIHQQKEEAPTTAVTPLKTQKKKGTPALLIAAIVIFCCIVGALIYFLFFRSENVSGTVTGVGWERTIAIEGLVPVEYSDWHDQIPSDGEILECRQEVRSVESEPQPNAEEICGTPYSVDMGGGYAEVVQDCEYRVYEAYCSYSVIEWAVVDTISLSGRDFDPDWPDSSLTTDERMGSRSETYVIYFDADDQDYTYSIDNFEQFQAFEIGSQWNLEVNAIGGVLSVER
jgi:hypothetical protein